MFWSGFFVGAGAVVVVLVIAAVIAFLRTKVL